MLDKASGAVSAALQSFSKAAVLFFLGLTSVLSLVLTIRIADYAESYYYNDLTAWAPVVAYAAVLLLVLRWKRFRELALQIPDGVFLGCMLGLSLLISVTWINFADAPQGFDSKDLLDAASYLLGDQAYAHLWIGEGAYMERFPFQAPFVLLLAALELIAGEDASMLFQYVNCLCVPVILLGVYLQVAAIAPDNRYARRIVLVIGLLFVPLSMYCTFVYGNTISLAFCMIAFALFLKGIKEGKLLLVGLAYALTVIGILLKSSMLLVLVAMVFVTVVMLLHRWKPFLCVVTVAALVVYAAASSFIPAAIGKSVGADTDNGLPSLAWIVMGTGADDGAEKNLVKAGWYSGYVWDEFPGDYTAQEYSDRSKELLVERVKAFASDPVFAFRFFGMKYAYEWCEPTYGCILSSNWTTAEPGGVPMADRDLGMVAHSVYYGRLNTVTQNMADGIQFVIYAGAFVFFWLRRKEIGIDIMAPALYAAGGALFYLFWEMKSQYVLPMTICLIPYAALGLACLCERGKAAVGPAKRRFGRRMFGKDDVEHYNKGAFMVGSVPTEEISAERETREEDRRVETEMRNGA